MLRRVVGALVSGGVLCLAFPTFDVWVAAPVSLALLALVITGVRPRAGFGLGFLAGLAFFLPTLHWAGVYVGNLPWLALAALQALFFGVVGVLYAWLSRTGAVRPLAFAVVWVVVEGLRARAPYGGFPWVKLAFSQADSPFGHLASLGGAPFVGFVLALAGALLAVVASRARGRMPLGSLALAGCLRSWIGQTQTGSMGTVSRNQVRNSAVRSRGISTSWMTRSRGSRPRLASMAAMTPWRCSKATILQ